MTDPTEHIRRQMLAEPDTILAELEQWDGPTWDPEELKRDFEVLGYMAPFVVVRRRSDGITGSLKFPHEPRRYFDWKEHEPDV
jgi:hypothetical protein